MTMSVVLAVDPGPTHSAWLVYNPATRGIRSFGRYDNEQLLASIRGDLSADVSDVVIEKVESFGMAVGAEVFETVHWSGRFHEAADQAKRNVHRIGRMAVKMTLCHNSRAKDANIRQALIDRFGGETAIGRKAKPGPLYKIAGDVWSALAVAVSWAERQ